ncbi:hypothetical protein BJX66DRAFT_319491 [Aspergillus keveii]|uniref:Secreted protein n=1 Tax=Aspergillus keveii TaxID=714993 RepID=A0ABR4FI69_9EURO
MKWRPLCGRYMLLASCGLQSGSLTLSCLGVLHKACHPHMASVRSAIFFAVVDYGRMFST